MKDKSSPKNRATISTTILKSYSRLYSRNSTEKSQKATELRPIARILTVTNWKEARLSRRLDIVTWPLAKATRDAFCFNMNVRFTVRAVTVKRIDNCVRSLIVLTVTVRTLSVMILSNFYLHMKVYNCLFDTCYSTYVDLVKIQ